MSFVFVKIVFKMQEKTFSYWKKNFGLKLQEAFCMALIIGTLIVSDCECLSYVQKPLLRKPKIFLSSYSEVDSVIPKLGTEFQNMLIYENNAVSKNGSEYVITTDARDAVFTCEADYPIMWKLPNPEQFSGTTSFELGVTSEITSTFDEHLAQPQNTKYYSHLLIRNQLYRYHSLSGDLACHSIQNPTLYSKIYVYTEAQFPMDNIGLTVQVNVSSATKSVILPCRPAHPTDVSISLLKRTAMSANFQPSPQNSTSWTWEPVSLSVTISFDPRRGFILANTGFSDICGTYKCVVDGEEDTAYKIIKVTQGTEPSYYDFEPVSTITSRNAHYTVERNSVKCCTGNINSPAVGAAFLCKSGAECDLFKPVFIYDALSNEMSNQVPTTYVTTGRTNRVSRIFVKPLPPVASQNDDCFKTDMQIFNSLSSRLFVCHGTGIDVMAHFVNAFQSDNISNALNNQGSRIFQTFDLAKNNTMTVANKINFDIQVPQWNRYQQGYIDPTRNFGNQYYYHAIPYYGGMMSLRRIRPYYVPLPSRGHVFEGESLLVTCIAHPMFYAKGGWLRLNWKNGSISLLKKVSASDLLPGSAVDHLSIERMQLVTALTSGGRQTVEYIGVTLLHLSQEMKSLDCFAPVWDGGNWEKHTYNLDVKIANLPVIQELKEESLLLKLNETGVQINCTIMINNQSRVLLELLYWEKDGHRLDFNNDIGKMVSSYTANTTTVMLTLHAVNHVTQGEYRCVGKNVRGEVAKVLKIFVDDGKEGPGMVILIGGLCVCLLLAIVGGLTWRHWHLRRSMRVLSR